MKKIKYFFWKLFKYFGVELLPDENKNSIQSYLHYLVKKSQFNLVLDVGSNVGQFYKLTRNIGFIGEIQLFEPLLECQKKLQKVIRFDRSANLNSFALGDKEEVMNFFVTKNNVSSSILLPKDSTKVVNSYEINVKKLDSLGINFSKYSGILLKIDAQGYEKNVILGCSDNLKFISYILTELSISSQYVGEIEMIPMIEFMKNLGYFPIFIYPGITNKSNEVIQYEVIFKRSISKE